MKIEETLNEAGEIAQASIEGTAKAVLYMFTPVLVLGLAVSVMVWVVRLPSKLTGSDL